MLIKTGNDGVGNGTLHFHKKKDYPLNYQILQNEDDNREVLV